jgi:hypothetical protein
MCARFNIDAIGLGAALGLVLRAIVLVLNK